MSERCDTKSSDTPAIPARARKIVVGGPNSPAETGRRAFFTYKDLGIADATDGKMSATITSATQGLSRPTGWHYHVSDVQFIYMVKGWVDLEFEDGTFHHLVAGESIYIPSGLKHNELATSEELELVEVQVPAGMKTVPCDPPPGWKTLGPTATK